EILSARFAPDGQTILYTAAWENRPMEIFSRRLESPESRSSGLPGTELLAVSSAGEMAVSLARHTTENLIRDGRLAPVSVGGGVAPRELREDIHWADWSPDGKTLAVVRDVAGRNSLEYPPGKVLYQTVGFISHPRVSPSGDAVAFIDHPTRGDDGGAVSIVDR